MVFEELSLIVRASSTILLFGGLVYAGIQLKATKKIHEQNHDWNRRVNALRFSFADDPKLIGVLERMDKHFEINSSFPEEIKFERMEEKKEEYPSVFNDTHFALARLEAMCIAIENGVADEEICKSLLKTRVITFLRMFYPYIEVARTKRKTENLFRNLEDYAAKWQGNNKQERPKTGEFD